MIGDRPAPDPRSPRFARVVACRDELLRIAKELGATRIALSGSVARGQDTDKSDIDFYLEHSGPADHTDHVARERGKHVREEYHRILEPYCVDIFPLPGWDLDSRYEAGMRRDAIDLEKL